MPILLLTLISAVYFYFFGLRGFHIDESFQLSAIARMAQGDLPWKDFFLQFPPLAFSYSKVFFQLFHHSVFGFRLSIYFLVLGILIVNYFIANHFLKDVRKSFLATLFSLVWSPIIFPVVSYTPLATLFVSLSVLLALKTSTESLAFYFFCSILGSLAFLTKQNLGACVFLVFMYRFVQFFNREKFRMIVPAVLLSLVGSIISFSVVLLPYRDHLDVFFNETVINVLTMKKGSFVFPFRDKPLKSLVLSIFAILFFLFQSRVRVSNFKLFKKTQFLIGSFGVLLLIYSIFNSSKIAEHFRWYFTIYSHNLIFILLVCIVLRIIINRRNYFLHFLVVSTLFYFVAITGGMDLTHILTSSYILFFTLALWLIIQEAYGTFTLFLCFALSIQISSSTSATAFLEAKNIRISDGVLKHIALTEYQVLKPQVADCVQFANQNKTFIFQSVLGDLFYYGAKNKNYYWYFDGQYSGPEIDQKITKELLDKDYDFLIVYPRNRDFILNSSFPKFSKAIDEMFVREEHPSCEFLYISNRLKGEIFDDKKDRPILRH